MQTPQRQSRACKIPGRNPSFYIATTIEVVVRLVQKVGKFSFCLQSNTGMKNSSFIWNGLMTMCLGTNGRTDLGLAVDQSIVQHQGCCHEETLSQVGSAISNYNCNE